MSPASSSRWCPTPEQLMILEEMYRGGTRTPNASQIQQITAHLSFYGKIEGKNVFYWFQNHKARDRQKLRRKLSKQMHQQQQLLYHHHHHHPNIQQNHHHPNIQQNNHHHHLLHYLDQSPPSPAASAQVSHYSPVGFLPQGGVEGGASPQMTSYSSWKMQGRHLSDQGLEMDNKSMGIGRTCGCDWMMMMDVGPTAPCCRTVPLKTLELFPISPTALKDEHTTPSSASTNY